LENISKGSPPQGMLHLEHLLQEPLQQRQLQHGQLEQVQLQHRWAEPVGHSSRHCSPNAWGALLHGATASRGGSANRCGSSRGGASRGSASRGSASRGSASRDGASMGGAIIQQMGPRKEAKNPKTLTKNEFEKTAKLLTHLASSKSTAASKKLHSAKNGLTRLHTK